VSLNHSTAGSGGHLEIKKKTIRPR